MDYRKHINSKLVKTTLEQQLKMPDPKILQANIRICGSLLRFLWCSAIKGFQLDNTQANKSGTSINYNTHCAGCDAVAAVALGAADTFSPGP